MARTAAPKTTAVVTWKARIAEKAKAVTQIEKATSAPRFSIAGEKLSFGGQPVPDNKAQIVVIGYSFENTLYKGKYDPKNPTSPACFAMELAENEESEARLAPHDSVEAPEHESCKDCPMNQFGSAEVGDGKACKNTRKLAVIMPTAFDSADAMLSSEVAVLVVPPTSLKNWKTYVRALGQQGLVTEVMTTEVEYSDKKLFFYPVEGGELVDKITEEVWEAFLKKQEEAKEILLKPYEKPNPDAAPKKTPPSVRASRFTAPAAPKRGR